MTSNLTWAALQPNTRHQKLLRFYLEHARTSAI